MAEKKNVSGKQALVRVLTNHHFRSGSGGDLGAATAFFAEA
jgi:hypothetical protein